MRTALLVSRDVSWSLSLACAWVGSGRAVTLILLDSAVASARLGNARAAALREAMEAGVAVAAEERALQRRAMTLDRLVDGVKVVDLDEVADLVVDGADKAVWL